MSISKQTPSQLADQSWHFDPLEPVGQGTSGTVWKAIDLNSHNHVAIKVAKDPQSIHAIAHEAESLLLTDSPFIPSVVSLGKVPAGIPSLDEGSVYLALQWMTGQRLDPLALLSDQRVPIAFAVARDVGAALDDLHQAGMAHGDIKPDNILLSTQEGSYRAALVDLGFSTPIHGETMIGATPRYAPPEMAIGTHKAAPHDLWALGICLAEILDPWLAKDPDPVTKLWSCSMPAPWRAWTRALTATQPSSRPSASWLRTAALLEKEGLGAEPPSKGNPVRASYLRVRRPEWPALRSAARCQLQEHTAPWLAHAIDVIRSAHALKGGEVHSNEIFVESLDPAGRKQWLVALVGIGAAAWNLPKALEQIPESDLALVLERLSRQRDPKRWTLRDILRAIDDEHPDRTKSDWDTSMDPVELALGLLQRPVDPALLETSEALHARSKLPTRHCLLLAEALRVEGNLGRAYSIVDGCSDPRSLSLRAELLRRMGKLEEAVEQAKSILDEKTEATETRALERAAAVWARTLLDQGEPSKSLEVLGTLSGACVAEVRALAHLSLGEKQEALRAIEHGLAVAVDDEERARLHCVRGMEQHAQGQSLDAYLSFSKATDHAARAGAVVEEATYQTGLAAAAVDAGRVSTALDASLRATLMWEHLGQPHKIAYALLARASAYSLAGEVQDAHKTAERALFHAREAKDSRATAFLLMLLSDVVSDEQQRLQLAQEAGIALGPTPLFDDLLRVEARRLKVFALSEDEIREMDRRLEGENGSVTSRTEWWTGRAHGWIRGPHIGRSSDMVARLLRLVREPMPVGVRGPAMDAARRLAAAIGDGESTRLLSAMQRKLSLDLLEHVPPWLRERAVSVPWILEPSEGLDMAGSAERVRNLETLVRSMAGRESLRRLLEQALDALVLWTGVERGLLLLRAPGDRLVVRAARNLARRDLAGEQLKLSQSLAQRALTSREPVVAVDAAGEIADVHRSVHVLGLRSVLAVPLLARGEVLGVVYLDDRVRKGAFGPQELAWVRLVAGIAAMAIADARSQLLLRREARRAARAEGRAKTELARREAELEQVERELSGGKGRPRRGYESIVGESAPMRAMLAMVDRVAATDLPVLVDGESGTGKELVARALHDNSRRSAGPFVTENCSAIPEPLFESTLFGHVRGAFTGADRRRLGSFEAADGGTLFLDEVGEIPLHLQTKLLRVLQDGEIHPLGGPRTTRVDVRVVAATNRDLREFVTAGKFREDLFYRLNVIAVSVPSLRERIEDVSVLVRYFLSKYGEGRSVKVSRQAWSRLESYDWPGNVRQLENEVRRALALCEGVIGEEDLTAQVRGQAVRFPSMEGLSLRARVDALERSLVQEALAKTGGNQTRAARILGVSRYGLQKMIKRLGI